MSSALTGGSGSIAEHEVSAFLLIDRNYPEKLRNMFLFKKLGFTYLPEEINHSGAEATYNDIDIIGRWSHYQVYQSTTAEEFSFTLQFFAYNNSYSDVVAKVNFLRALKYPINYQGISYRPPKVLFVFGDLISKMCIVKEASPVYRAPWDVFPGQQENLQVFSDNEIPDYPLYPMVAECSLTLGVVSDTPISGGSVSWGIDNIQSRVGAERAGSDQGQNGISLVFKQGENSNVG
jgi:hypothetical protein